MKVNPAHQLLREEAIIVAEGLLGNKIGLAWLVLDQLTSPTPSLNFQSDFGENP